MSIRSAIFFAKVITSDLRDVMKVSISKYVMDERLTMYFKESSQHYVIDTTNKCKEGDYVLIRELPEKKGEITHAIEKIIYERGNLIDPLTGKKCAGHEYIDDIKRLSELFGKKPSYLE